ncbi:MAG TPA: hydrogenase maturation nickel metallochaperone HypA, partial [Burkholderiaceae bacterium]|nr:hydrogenase maturation nickel metallochaperone HypA [Burkholderiaceae bacterium]
GFVQVAVLRLEAGALAGVAEHALRFALASLAPGTCLEGARIEIDTPPGRARCTACGAESPIEARTDPCPACGAWSLVPTSGLDLKVVEVLVRDGPGQAVARA